LCNDEAPIDLAVFDQLKKWFCVRLDARASRATSDTGAHRKTGQPSAIGEAALPEDVSNLEAVCASVCNLTNYAALGNASLPILLASLIAYITLSVSVW
jgi:hypothetical protein